MDNMELAVIILITGLVVVFVVLILLTLVIKLYSTLVHKAQHQPSKKAELKQEPPKPALQPVQAAPAVPQVETGIPGEVVAAIAAAVAYSNEESGSAYVVKGIKRAAGSRPVWSMAGLMDNTRPF